MDVVTIEKIIRALFTIHLERGGTDVGTPEVVLIFTVEELVSEVRIINNSFWDPQRSPEGLRHMKGFSGLSSYVRFVTKDV